MKRTPMKRSTKPMKRRWMKTSAPAPVATLPPEERAPRRAGPEFRYGTVQLAALFRPIPKDNAIQHEGYMAIVRKLPCARCGRLGPSQFCHSDILGAGGKAMALKSDCRLGWPGCGPHGNEPGCHWFVGTSGQMFKAARHDFEADAARRTREAVTKLGLWPKNLPEWQ